MKHILTVGLLALSILTVAQGAEIRVTIGPPPPPREVVIVRPGPRYVWVPGYYRWNGRHYVWVTGYWSLPPQGRTTWIPGRWEYRGGVPIWIEGRWR